MAYTATLLKKMGLSGGNSLRTYDISPDAATGNFTVSDVSEAYVIGCVPLSEDTDAATDHAIVQAKENSSTANQVDCKLWTSPNVAASTYKDFRVTLLCI